MEIASVPGYKAGLYFKEQVPGSWARAVMLIDVTGDRSATLQLIEDDDHLPIVDYVGFEDDPIFSYQDDHRAELEQIARRVYGTDTTA